MSLSESQVKKIAHLARLKVSGPEVEKYTNELNKILGFVEQLSEVNTDGVEPLYSVHKEPQPLRKDVVSDGDI